MAEATDQAQTVLTLEGELRQCCKDWPWCYRCRKWWMGGCPQDLAGPEPEKKAEDER